MISSLLLILSKIVLAMLIESCFQAVCQDRSTLPVEGFQLNSARRVVRVIDR